MNLLPKKGKNPNGVSVKSKEIQKIVFKRIKINSKTKLYQSISKRITQIKYEDKDLVRMI